MLSKTKRAALAIGVFCILINITTLVTMVLPYNLGFTLQQIWVYNVVGLVITLIVTLLTYIGAKYVSK